MEIVMERIDNIIQLIESLNGGIENFGDDEEVDINDPDWFEEARRRSEAMYSEFEDEINGLNDELASAWRQFSKQDIMKLQDVLEKADNVPNMIGVRVDDLTESSLLDALFLLLLKSRHTDYRDCLLGLGDLMQFADRVDCKVGEQSREADVLFDDIWLDDHDFGFHAGFRQALLNWTKWSSEYGAAARDLW
jgi:hypothetical protein